jgi:hypothetical protein
MFDGGREGTLAHPYLFFYWNVFLVQGAASVIKEFLCTKTRGIKINSGFQKKQL